MFSQCTVGAATVSGVSATPVQVEVVVSGGLPAFTIVGMTDAAIQDAKERIRAALRASGFSMPSDRITVNLAPGALKKRGSGFDLPIAVALLAATGQINRTLSGKGLFVGELSLDGVVRPIPGLLAYASRAQELGVPLICADSPELDMVSDKVELCIVDHLRVFKTGQFKEHARGAKPLEPNPLDFCHIAGHDHAKRALQIAAAGNHGILMVGPPGSGKTMLASRMPSILPPLTAAEMLEVATIHSIAGEPIEPILAGSRPFRAPHHSASLAGLVGGGTPIRPGEISLAHKGVLFLDELPEFKPSVLQGLRQPMESGSITAVRAEGSVELPAQFSLVAAANPCPCGHFGDPDRSCTCSAAQINGYQNRIGGPVLDRIDMSVTVGRLDPLKVLASGQGTSSDVLREGVLSVREYRSWRESVSGVQEKTPQGLMKACDLAQETLLYFQKMAEKRRFSGRAIVRVLGVARTIADLEQRKSVSKEDIAEAASYRMEERGSLA